MSQGKARPPLHSRALISFLDKAALAFVTVMLSIPHAFFAWRAVFVRALKMLSRCMFSYPLLSPRMKEIIDFQLIEVGAVYPLFYDTLSADLFDAAGEVNIAPLVWLAGAFGESGVE